MLWLECRIVDALRGRRRMRATAVKLPCSFWFLLLFGAGGLVLFIHLQDLSEMVQQQAPVEVTCRSAICKCTSVDSFFY
ncbi:hypothetical protein DPEC_G00254660 [Dallia pectoralis]|uniref:Uncharacterized protein n=1 Tax=Dallia pectoralis TaxID=75939 RepID=A0ACC2FUB2_DALPE|nr:hypothetical protein DPEC_G00254660 [Dallia pectoralis]